MFSKIILSSLTIVISFVFSVSASAQFGFLEGLSGPTIENEVLSPKEEQKFERYQIYRLENYIAGIYMPDANLRACIEENIRKSAKDVTMEDVLRMYSLRCENKGVVSLKGLSNFSNLLYIYLSGNRISDISELQSLVKMAVLFLGDNDIRNISPLAALTQLTDLNLAKNDIQDISPLATLPRLNVLSLNDNFIENIDALRHLSSQLTHLYIGHNNISDISPLEELQELRFLALNDNNISDISALSLLYKLYYLNLSNNAVRDTRPLYFLESIWDLDISHNQIESLRHLELMIDLEILHANNNSIHDISVLFTGDPRNSDLRFPELYRLRLGNNRIVNTAASPYWALYYNYPEIDVGENDHLYMTAVCE